MKNLKNKIINIDKKKVLKKATFWNLVASMLNAFMSAIFLFFITRINGVDEAGMFTIASAFAYQALSLGSFGVRNFQASDVKEEYKYSDYVYTRVMSGTLMYMLLIYFAFFKGYTIEKALIILTFGLYKSIDAIEDVIHGEFQRRGRLDIGCLVQSVRYICSIIFLIIILLITKNVIISCSLLTVFTIFLLIILNIPFKKEFINEKISFNRKKTIKLFFTCLPICISNAVNMYVVNCPKYAIDNILTDKYQTYYGVLSMPVFTINLLSMVIYRPYVKSLGDSWQNKNIKEFRKIILKQLLIILLLTVGISLFGYIIGLTVIEIIYGIKLHSYMLSFILLLIGGGMNALSGYLSVILTTQRNQNKLLFGYIFTFIVALLTSNIFVKSKGILGAAYLYCFINLVTVIIFSIFIIKNINQLKGVKNEKNK